MGRYRDRRTRHTIRAFAAGGACGFVLGALLVLTVASRVGLPGALARTPREGVPSNAARLPGEAPGMDDAGEGVLRGGDAKSPVGTSGGAARPAPSPEPVLTTPAAEGLEARDLDIPVQGVSEDQLTRSFTEDRGGRAHEAIDILAPRNTPVKAVEDGTIARLFYSKAGGITIYQFDPAGQFCYYYAHLERYADGLTEGMYVRKGQVIGYVGTSGNAPKDTPHLHFAIFRLTAAKRWWEGTPIDPYDILR